MEVGFFQRFFHLQPRDGQRSDHFKGEETNDVDRVVVGAEVEVGR